MADIHKEKMDRLFRYDRENGTITYTPKDYEIDLERISTPKQLLGWALHLGDKPWMTKEVLCECIQRVADIKG